MLTRSGVGALVAALLLFAGSLGWRYEELLVNPTLLELTRQRGNIDCGGLEYLVIRYGNFFQLVLPPDVFDMRGIHNTAITITGSDGHLLQGQGDNSEFFTWVRATEMIGGRAPSPQALFATAKGQYADASRLPLGVGLVHRAERNRQEDQYGPCRCPSVNCSDHGAFRFDRLGAR